MEGDSSHANEDDAEEALLLQSPEAALWGSTPHYSSLTKGTPLQPQSPDRLVALFFVCCMLCCRCSLHNRGEYEERVGYVEVVNRLRGMSMLRRTTTTNTKVNQMSLCWNDRGGGEFISADTLVICPANK